MLRFGMILVVMLSLPSKTWSQDPDSGSRVELSPSEYESSENDDPRNGPSIEGGSTWTDLLRAVLLTAIPDKYEDRKHWGDTVEVVKGFRVRQRGLLVQITPRTKEVKDGVWYRYQIEFPKPERNIKLAIEDVQTLGAGHFAFTVKLTVTPRCMARFENWVVGVKGLNFTAVSDATVLITASCLLEIRSERTGKSWMPDIILEPSVQKVRLKLHDIETRRVGEFRGDIAEELGNGSRSFVQKILNEQEPRVLKKINSAINKKKDSLRFSALFGSKAKPDLKKSKG